MKNEKNSLTDEQSKMNLKLEKIDQAYASPPWWYDLRGFFILTFAYRSNLFQQVRFFNKNIRAKHLEAAIGTGTLFDVIIKWRRLVGAPTSAITAFDYAEKMLDGAKRRFAKNKNIHLQRSDISQLDIENDSFDSVNIANSLHCFPNIELALKEIHRVLKPGGTLALNVLLYPEGNSFFQKLATRINNWRIKKGILHTPYKQEVVAEELNKIGYQLLEQKVYGNSCNFLAQKSVRISREEADFNSKAFSRNLGWITQDEAKALSNKRVAIAGLGGVGGSHLITLARLGISKFHIADFDSFEVQNFNRQYGADTSTLNRKKIDVMREKLLLINPFAEVICFESGVHQENLDAFLKCVDLFVDGLDVFEIEIRRMVFKKADDLCIPAISVAPIGMGVASVTFLPGKMSFEDYFGFVKGPNEKLENLCRFLLGMSPSLIHLPTLVDRSFADLKQQKAPSTPMGCQLASGVLGTQALKILLNRKNLSCAPHGMHFDAYLAKFRRTWMPFGSKNWSFQLKLRIFLKLVSQVKSPISAHRSSERYTLQQSQTLEGKIANQSCQIVDVSLNGFCIRTDSIVNQNEVLEIKLNSTLLESKSFKVRRVWQDENRCGLQIIEDVPSWPGDLIHIRKQEPEQGLA